MRVISLKLFCLLATFSLFSVSFVQADEVDDLFSDSGALDVAETKTIDNPVTATVNENKFQWAGDFSGTAGSKIGYQDQLGKISDLGDPDENLLLSLKARLWFDARPDNNFRVFGKFQTDYPFETEVLTGTTDSSGTPVASGTETVTNFKVFELFSDFNWKDKVFFRFGKQNTGWGVSRFYQIGDPLSVGVKDPTDPAADLEGPVALKATIPFGLNSLVFVSAVKESYLPADMNEASIRDVGLGVKADFYVKVPENKNFGNGQFTLGAYEQRHLAPKLVASYSTSIRKFQIFTDQAVSFGLDSYRLSSDEATYGYGYTGESITVRDTEKPKQKPFYSATLGTMYVDSVNHFTLYAEYLFSGAGSMNKDEYKDWLIRYYLETSSSASAPGIPRTLALSDLESYLGMHNTGMSISWSEIFNNEDLGFSTTWLQNWVDLSGMVKPALSWEPIKYITLESGAYLVWGKDDTEWVVKTSSASTLEPVRTVGYLMLKLENVRF